MAKGHTLKAFDDDLDRLRALISEMGGLAEHAIRESMRCLQERAALGTLASGLAVEGDEPYEPLRQSGRMLPPLTHPQPHRCLVSGTGLTHLGSASTRDAMHTLAAIQLGEAW